MSDPIETLIASLERQYELISGSPDIRISSQAFQIRLQLEAWKMVSALLAPSTQGGHDHD